MSAPAVPSPSPSLPRPEPCPGAEEVDLWWGSFAGRTLTPSFAVCVLLTAGIYVLVQELVRERGWLQLAFVAAAGAVWLVQLVRWAHRFFTWNYRLTTHYLYVDNGIWPLIARRLTLQSIDRVEVRSSKLARWLGVGDLWVFVKDTATPPVILQGLCHPRHAADLIRAAVRKATEVLS